MFKQTKHYGFLIKEDLGKLQTHSSQEPAFKQILSLKASVKALICKGLSPT